MRNVENAYVFQFFSPSKEKTYAYKVGDKTMKQKQRGRPNLCRGTKERKKIFDNRLQGYSLQALENVIHIAESAYDVNTKLKANCYLLDKTVGKEYKSIEQNRENEQKELSINLNIVEQKHSINTEQIETELKEIEADLEDDESWGDNLYTP